MVSPCCSSSRHIAHSPVSLLSTSSLYVILGFVKHITRCKSISSEGTNFEHTGHLNPPNKCGERWAGSEPITRRGPPGPPPAGRSRSLAPTLSSGLLCTESCEPYGPPLLQCRPRGDGCRGARRPFLFPVASGWRAGRRPPIRPGASHSPSRRGAGGWRR